MQRWQKHVCAVYKCRKHMQQMIATRSNNRSTAILQPSHSCIKLECTTHTLHQKHSLLYASLRPACKVEKWRRGQSMHHHRALVGNSKQLHQSQPSSLLHTLASSASYQLPQNCSCSSPFRSYKHARRHTHQPAVL